jgi:hypothetical protein
VPFTIDDPDIERLARDHARDAYDRFGAGISAPGAVQKLVRA